MPKVGSGILLADYYGVTLDYLYGREERHIASQGDSLTDEERDFIDGLRALSGEARSVVIALLLRLTLRRNNAVVSVRPDGKQDEG